MPKNPYAPARTLAELVREQGYDNQLGFNNEELYWDSLEPQTGMNAGPNGEPGPDPQLPAPSSAPGYHAPKPTSSKDPAPGNPYA